MQHVLAMFVGNLTPILVIGGACSLGDLSGITEGGLGREATDKELSGGVACDGIGYIFGGSGIVPAAIVAIYRSSKAVLLRVYVLKYHGMNKSEKEM